jgi:serine phosphatase RsbU (regulator of sigma subunit)/anti-sigma regulatory factor (Ser/Thr protein kinase)
VRIGQWQPADPAELTASRQQLAAALPDDVDREAADRLLLAFEELASNAIRHGLRPITVTVTDTADGWLLTVQDRAGDRPPTPAVDRDPALGGLGLCLVARLAAAHGWTDDGTGKTVWARIEHRRASAAPAPAPLTPAAPAPALFVPAAAAGRPSPAGPPRSARPARPGRRRGFRIRSPRRLAAIVAVLTFAVSAVLSVLTWHVTQANEHRLLARQLAQVGTLLTSQAAVLQVQLADIGQAAVNTDGDPDVFARWADGQLTETGQSLSLWRIADGRAEQLAVAGIEPLLPPGGTDDLASLEPGELSILGVRSAAPEPDRLVYAYMPVADDGDLVVYAESPLPPDRRMPAAPHSPVEGLDLAIYLGERAAPETLLQATAATPIDGDTDTVTVPFGDTSVTVVGASPTPLIGPLAAALPWIVLGFGAVLAAAGGATVATLTRRRALAERLAADNDRLYRQQRGIAGTLQRALLPGVPALDQVEIAARYRAGADEIVVGGDWYDVVPVGPGRVVFVVGDVSGRGLPAATTMAALRFAARAHLTDGADIETVLAKLRRVVDVETDHQFATVLLGELDVPAGRLRLLSAGHLRPLLLTDGGVTEVDVPPAPPVGVDAPQPPGPVVVPVSGRATLLAFTDGLVERRGEVLDDGLKRLRTAAADAAGSPLPRLLDDVLDALVDDRATDDTVLLGLHWAGAPVARSQASAPVHASSSSAVQAFTT